MLLVVLSVVCVLTAFATAIVYKLLTLPEENMKRVASMRSDGSMDDIDGLYEGLPTYLEALKWWSSVTGNTEVFIMLPGNALASDMSHAFNILCTVKEIPSSLLSGRAFGPTEISAKNKAAKILIQGFYESRLVSMMFVETAAVRDLRLDSTTVIKNDCCLRWRLLQNVLFKVTGNGSFANETQYADALSQVRTELKQSIITQRYFDRVRAKKRKCTTTSKEPTLAETSDIQPKKSRQDPPALPKGIRIESEDSGSDKSPSITDAEFIPHHVDTPASSSSAAPFPAVSGTPLPNFITMSDDDEGTDDDVIVSNGIDEHENDDFDLFALMNEAVDEQLDVNAISEEPVQWQLLDRRFPKFDPDQCIKIIAGLKARKGASYESIMDGITHHYGTNLQNEETLKWKNDLKNALESVVRLVYKKASIHAVGSTMNGCGSFNADMDLCVLIPDASGEYKIDRNFVFECLKNIRKCIRKNFRILGKMSLIRAVVPIIQLQCQGSYTGLDVDLNINNIAGIYNTHLIHHYSRIDERFPAICLIVKHWAIIADINSAVSGTMNSYTLVLLVLHYMQCAFDPPVLPNLQELAPDVFNGRVPVSELKYFVDMVNFECQNRMDMVALLIGFFKYYSEFDFGQYAISVRQSGVFRKADIPVEIRKNYCMFIEEPFDRRNTARCVRAEYFHIIKRAFTEAYRILTMSKNPRLEDIGVAVYSDNDSPVPAAPVPVFVKNGRGRPYRRGKKRTQ